MLLYHSVAAAHGSRCQGGASCRRCCRPPLPNARFGHPRASGSHAESARLLMVMVLARPFFTTLLLSPFRHPHASGSHLSAVQNSSMCVRRAQGSEAAEERSAAHQPRSRGADLRRSVKRRSLYPRAELRVETRAAQPNATALKAANMKGPKTQPRAALKNASNGGCHQT